MKQGKGKRTEENDRGIDRRTFLKGAAAVSAMAAVSIALPIQASAEDKKADAVSGATVIESQTEDKYSFFAEQVGHFNSQFLIKQGFGPYDEGEIVAEFTKCCSNRINPVLIQKYVHNSGRMFDTYYNMIPKGSRYLKDMNVHQAYGKRPYPIERSGYKTWAGCAQFRGDIFEKPIMGVAANSQLPGINKTIIKPDAEKHGATWYFGQEAVVLAKTGAKVSGCIAKNAAGYTKFVGKKAVVLATGDFSGNADMCNAFIAQASEDMRHVLAAGKNGYDVRSMAITERMGSKVYGEHPRRARRHPRLLRRDQEGISREHRALQRALRERRRL
jgi:hypothetical protein